MSAHIEINDERDELEVLLEDRDRACFDEDMDVQRARRAFQGNPTPETQRRLEEARQAQATIEVPWEARIAALVKSRPCPHCGCKPPLPN